MSKKVGGYTVTLTDDKNPPVVGDNTIGVNLKDSNGQAVHDAKVAIDYSMPAMPGMPAMKYKANAPINGDAYQAMINLSMAGPWSIAIRVTPNGSSPITANFNVEAH